MNKVFLEALQDATAADRSGAGRYDFDQAAFQRGAKWAFDWARKPQDSTTCLVGHPRACWVGLTEHEEDCACFGDTAKHSQDCANCDCEYRDAYCSACKSQREAVDAALRQVEHTIISFTVANHLSVLKQELLVEIHNLREGRKGK